VCRSINILKCSPDEIDASRIPNVIHSIISKQIRRIIKSMIIIVVVFYKQNFMMSKDTQGGNS
jgi:hypothetical protein